MADKAPWWTDLPRVDPAVAEDWLADEVVPATPEEMERGLRDALAVARERGWIPAKDLDR
jgi:hypothetical protein